MIDQLAQLLAPLFHAGPALVFWGLALVTVVAAVSVVASRSPVHSALFLLLTFVSVAGIFFGAGAEFVGAVQILVYAGGIMVLFLFVVMLVNVERLATEATFQAESRMAVALGVVLAAVLGIGLVTALRGAPIAQADAATLRAVPGSVSALAPGAGAVGNSKAVGLLLYGRFLVPFEVASILLLVAMIGAIALGKKRLESEEVDH